MNPGAKRLHQIILFLAILATVFIVHSPFLQYGFFLDDLEYIYTLSDSPLINVLSPFQKFFYRPVFLAWFWSFLHLFGENPLPLHAGNLILFSVVIYLLGILVYRLSHSFKLAALSAVLFFLWPGKLQAIWWISCASTLLAASFFLATLLSWYSYRLHGGARYYCAALLSMLLALCSKEDAHALPLVLLGFEVYLLSTLPRFAPHRAAVHLRRHWLAYVPFAVAVVLYLICDIIALKNSAFVQQAYVTLPRNRAVTALAFTTRMWPFALVMLPVVASAAWALAMLASLYIACRKSKAASLLLFWTLCICVLIGAEASQENLGSERFLFLPAIPASILLAAGLRGLWRAQERRTLLWAALTTATVIAFAPLALTPLGLPASMIGAAILVCLGLVLWKMGRVTLEIYLVALVVLLAALASGAAPNYICQLAGMAIAAVVIGRRHPSRWWQGSLAFILLWRMPVYSATLFLLLAATQPLLTAYVESVKRRWGNRPSPSSRSEPAFP